MTRSPHAELVEACNALTRVSGELRSALTRRREQVFKYRGAFIRMARIVSDVEHSAEPRSYQNAYEALRRIVAEFYHL